MILLEGRVASYGELWFDEEAPRDAGFDIAVYRQRCTPVAGARTEPFVSLVTGLDVPEGAIAAGFGSECRHKIRRADSRDGLSLLFLREPGDQLADFCVFYDSCARKRAAELCDLQWLGAAGRAGQLVLSAVLRAGEPLAWHAYVMAGTTAQLQYTASSFREQASSVRALVGRANRWLHWRSMLQFRELGLARYDWGGVFEDESSPERAGINRFKQDFGGRRERSYNCVLPVTLRGRLYLPLRAAWHRLQARL